MLTEHADTHHAPDDGLHAVHRMQLCQQGQLPVHEGLVAGDGHWCDGEGCPAVEIRRWEGIDCQGVRDDVPGPVEHTATSLCMLLAFLHLLCALATSRVEAAVAAILAHTRRWLCYVTTLASTDKADGKHVSPHLLHGAAPRPLPLTWSCSGCPGRSISPQFSCLQC